MKNAGICCLLLVVCCLLSVVFCLLSGVWCLLSVVCCSLSVVWCLLCVSRGRRVYTNVDEAFHIERASRSLAKTGLNPHLLWNFLSCNFPLSRNIPSLVIFPSVVFVPSLVIFSPLGKLSGKASQLNFLVYGLDLHSSTCLAFRSCPSFLCSRLLCASIVYGLARPSSGQHSALVLVMLAAMPKEATEGKIR